VRLGIFNYIFFTIYYKNVNKVGTAFVWASTAVFVYMAIAETCAHIIPFVRDYLDTKDPKFLADKLIVLAVGLAIYALLTFVAYKKSVKSFESLDL
jgi:hypothetical protein